MMVSHIDDDHVSGLLELARKLNDQRESGQPLPWKIRRFWHNSFDDILDNDDLQVGGERVDDERGVARRLPGAGGLG